MSHAADASRSFSFDDFTVDLDSRRLFIGESVVPLPSRVFDVLVHLIENRERSVQKDEIITAIWDDVVVTDDSLIHAISVLRRALGDEPQSPRYIETIPRRGYRFVGTIRESEAESAPAVGAVPGGDEPRPMQPDEDIDVPAPPASASTSTRLRSPVAVWTAVGVACLLLFASTVFLLRGESPVPGNVNNFDTSVRLFQTPPPGTRIVSSGALSPDSRYLAFIARDNESGQTGLWVRALNAGEARRIEGADGATKPFWAPDSARIGFFANGSLNTTDINGENLQSIASVSGAAGASWGANDRILFAEWATGLFSVPASGDGDVEPVLALERDAQDIAFASPQFFPGSRRFLYQIYSLDAQRSGAYVGNLDTLQSFKLLDTTSSATFAPPNYILHIQKDMLIAEELDTARLELTGHAVVVARDISEPLLATENFIAASADLLAFQHSIVQQNLAWYNREGEQLEALAFPTVLFNPRLSPDGKRLLASSLVTTDPGLWLSRLDREEVARIERDALAPVWSPDGQRIAFTSRDGMDMFVRPTEGPAQVRIVTSDDSVKVLSDWSPDGEVLVYSRRMGPTGLDIWVVDVESGMAQPILATPDNEGQARISPDGSRVAYASNETGSVEIYVADFPGMTNKQRVSLAGGGQPQWRTDMGELFFLAPDQTLMSSAIIQSDRLSFAPPRPLFRTEITGDPADARDYYAVDETGSRFLIDGAVTEGDDQQITVMVNWASRLRESQATPITAR